MISTDQFLLPISSEIHSDSQEYYSHRHYYSQVRLHSNYLLKREREEVDKNRNRRGKEVEKEWEKRGNKTVIEDVKIK